MAGTEDANALIGITKDRKRTNQLKKHEQKALVYFIQRIPLRVSSNVLTAIGLAGSFMIR